MLRRTLRRLQRRLERYYGLEEGADVAEFVTIAEPGQRELLRVRTAGSTLELQLVVPDPGQGLATGQPAPWSGGSTDRWLQVLEGVSHFVLLGERARTDLPITRLELELQAEVDKFVLLATGRKLPRNRARRLHDRLYHRVRFVDPPDTESGRRYRLANAVAARYVARLWQRHQADRIQHQLRRFYRVGQAEKLRLAGSA
jgi:hypothetical protein